jgi:hypothetical protein
MILSSIRESKSRIITNRMDIQRIRGFLRRKLDMVNVASHERNLSRYSRGTGEWLFQDSKFSDWASTNDCAPLLWLVGPEGSGKSVLCSLAANRMRQSPSQQAVVYLMLTFDNPRSEYHLVSQIALQLLDYVVEHHQGVNAEALLMLPEGLDDNKKTFQVRELIEVLVSQCTTVFFFVDGLDEVETAEHPERQGSEETKPESVQQQLLSVLSFMAGLTGKGRTTTVRLLCSSKQTKSVETWMETLEVTKLPLNRHFVAADITRYLEARLREPKKIPQSYSILPSDATIAHLRKASRNNFHLASTMADWIVFPILPGHDSVNIGALNESTTISDLYDKHLDRMQDFGNPSENMQSRQMLVM